MLSNSYFFNFSARQVPYCFIMSPWELHLECFCLFNISNMGDNAVLNIAYGNRTKAKIQIQNTKSYFLSRAYINNKHNELFTN
jgi:hypothetical protein